MVTLTDQNGAPITAGRMQLDYSSKIGEGETQTQAAQRLIWRHYRATKGGSDFNRVLDRSARPPGGSQSLKTV